MNSTSFFVQRTGVPQVTSELVSRVMKMLLLDYSTSLHNANCDIYLTMSSILAKRVKDTFATN